PKAAFLGLADAAPPAPHDLEDLAHDLLRRFVAQPADRARILVLHLGAAGLELPDAEIDPLEDVERLEAGHDNRHMELRRQRNIFLEAHDRAHMPGSEE